MFKYLKTEEWFRFLQLSNESSCTTAVHLMKPIKTNGLIWTICQDCSSITTFFSKSRIKKKKESGK